MSACVLNGTGVGQAVTGSLCPISITFLITYFGFELSGRGALACGLTLSPTSAGITLDILKAGGVLDQPVGQVIIAAAVVDDVLALVMLGQLEVQPQPSKRSSPPSLAPQLCPHLRLSRRYLIPVGLIVGVPTLVFGSSETRPVPRVRFLSSVLDFSLFVCLV